MSDRRSKSPKLWTYALFPDDGDTAILRKCLTSVPNLRNLSFEYSSSKDKRNVLLMQAAMGNFFDQ